MKKQLPMFSLALRLLLLSLWSALTPVLAAQGNRLPFHEDYALATERAKILELLIPGTADYYYYSCLERQSAGDFAASEELLGLWRERHAGDWRIGTMTNRQVLLSYDAASPEMYAYLKQQLNLGFAHLRRLGDQEKALPSRLALDYFDRERLVRDAFAKHQKDLSGFRDSALRALVGSRLGDTKLRLLLGRLERPDVPGLAQLVVHDLLNERSRGFGSLKIHKRLLLTQLDECARLIPDLLRSTEFVKAYLLRLAPSADVVWQTQTEEREAYLDRLLAFVRRLGDDQNSLKAHVLYRRLVHDRQLGKLSSRLFIEYLQLPRNAIYYNPDYLRSSRRRQNEVNFQQAYATGMRPIFNDEELVRSYLEHFFQTEDNTRIFAKYIQDDYLRRVFAETKILAGQGDMERWYSMLDDPSYYEALRARVEIEFAATQPLYYARDASVSIDVDIKNVGALLVKVFEINTFNYYRDRRREVDASIDLDGLVAGSERTIELNDAPLRRVRRRIDLPELQGPGVFVVELIGNGLSSRAVIHKGKLQLEERASAAGHVLRVRDETGLLLPEAKVWFSGREYLPDGAGEILIPYSTQPGRVEVLLQHGEETARADFQHAAESYALEAGIFVDREALVEGGAAQILVRPRLRLNGDSISLEALEEVVLVVTTLDQNGVANHLEIADFELHASRESVHVIQVAAGVAQLQVQLKASVQSMSAGAPVALASARRDFHLNSIDGTGHTDSSILGRHAGGYVIDVLGKNGEPKAGRRLNLSFGLRDFRDSARMTLETDAKGRVHLGALTGVQSVSVYGFPEQRTWNLLGDRRTLRGEYNGPMGETQRIPYSGQLTRPSRVAFSLIELRGGAFAVDRFDNLALASGYLELRNLPAGDFDLQLLESGRSVRVRVGVGTKQAGRLIGRDRQLELSPVEMQITELNVEGGDLVIQLANAGAQVSVHVFSTRYVPAYDIFGALFPRRWQATRTNWVEQPLSSYHSGREISDEYRYILERRYGQHMPGNMLSRPGLILNSWALDETVSTVGTGGGSGGRFGGREVAKNSRGAPSTMAARAAGAGAGAPGTFPNLDFLPRSRGMRLNLRPDAEGVVRVPIKDLGPGAQLHVLALDGNSEIYRSFTRPESTLLRRDRRLSSGLDPAQHLAQQSSIDFYAAGDIVEIQDAANAKLKVYDSLGAVHQIFSTLSGNADLARFDFVLAWPELTEEQKQKQYSEHACHELHFFLYQKDRAFFDAVVKPYLANKAHRTFMDEWLLERDLGAYLEPWAFAQLNTLERILLTRRLAGQGPSGQRHLREALEVLVPDPARRALLFATALRSGSLEKSAGLGLMLSEAKKLAKGTFRGPGDTVPPAGSPAAPLTPETLSALRGLGYSGGDDESEDLSSLGYMEESEENFDADAGSSEFFLGRGESDDKRDFERRKELRQLYRAPEPTRPYIESNYWHLTPRQTGPNLIQPNGFWLDYALADPAQPFGSAHFAEASTSFAEMMFALAVLDLPFQAGAQEVKSDGARLSMQAAGPLVVVSEQIRSASDAADALPILVSQSFFRTDDRYRFEGSQRLDKPVTKEFLVGVPYGAQVVITNPTSSPRQLELLLQIPEGALPLQRGFKTRGSALQLEPFGTETVDYFFYFPSIGDFSHYPVHVSRNGERVASAVAVRLNVVAKATEIDTSSWLHVSQEGSQEEVLAFLDAANLMRLELELIAWRLRDKAFFKTLVERLRARHHYAPLIWSYGILHRDIETTREYLSNRPRFLNNCGPYLDSVLVQIDPVLRKGFQLIEYSPLVNPRTHRFAGQQEILDKGFASQYALLLKLLAFRPQLDSEDWMSVTYYLLLQDRVPEAQASFARVKLDDLPTRVQFDYMSAYMDFFTPEHKKARAIAASYADYPVERWRLLFREVVDQLDEADGLAGGVSDPSDRGQQQGALAMSEPAMELRVEAQQVILEHQNLDSVTINYYEMDIEFLFSTSPFVQQGSGSFAYIRPNQSDQITLGEGTETRFELPAAFQKTNVLVEVRGAGMLRREAHYANSLTLGTFENYGQIKVTQSESGQPLSSVYVKVFARDSQGRVRFHKDGYTDLRGRFDYASLTGASDRPAERYSILVLSENDGAIIREVTPPQR